MLKKVLITGAGSKLVKPILKDLLPRAEKITLVTRNSDIDIDDPKIQHIKADLTEKLQLDLRADIVIHLAGVAPYGQACNASNSYLYDNNVRSFLNLLNYCSANKPEKLVFISSSDIYPLYIANTISEATDIRPKNIYGLYKLICEHCAKTYGEMFGFEVTILRMGPIYGPGMNRNLSVWKILFRVWNGESVELVNPENVLSLISTKDAAGSIVSAIDGAPGLYNIAGTMLTFEDFLERAAQVYGKGHSVSRKTESDGQIKLCFDLTAAKQQLEWEPSLFDDVTIKELSEEFQESVA